MKWLPQGQGESHSSHKKLPQNRDKVVIVLLGTTSAILQENTYTTVARWTEARD
jgi:hypothetical protein